MSEQSENKTQYSDSAVDAMAATITIAIVVSAVVFWISGQ